MHEGSDVRVAVVSSRHELDLAITTWVPGYVARQVTDVDTVIDLTSGGGIVLVDLADEDRSGWVRELRARGFEDPLVVLAPSEDDDRAEFDGSVLVSGPLRVAELGEAFDAARRRDPERLHRWVTPEPSSQSSAAAQDSVAEQGRAPDPRPGQVEVPDHSTLPPPTGPSPTLRSTPAEADAPSADPWDTARPDPMERNGEAPDTSATGSGAAGRSGDDGTSRADSASEAVRVDPSEPLPPPHERPMVVTDAAACAWVVLDELEAIVRDGGAVVAVRGSDASFTIAAGTGIAPFEGMTAVPVDHPLVASAGAGPSVLHVASTKESELPLRGFPLADCPALLVMLVPRKDTAAALVIIGRDAPFEPEEIATVAEIVLETPTLLRRVAVTRSGGDLHDPDTDLADGGGQRGVWPANEYWSVQVVTPTAVAAWHLVDRIFPVLEDGAAIVALRGTGGRYAPVAAARARPLEGARSLGDDHPLFDRLRARGGSAIVSPRTEDASFIAGLPLAHHTTILVMAIGEVGAPDALLLVGLSRVATGADFEPFDQMIRDGDCDLAAVAATAYLPRSHGPRI